MFYPSELEAAMNIDNLTTEGNNKKFFHFKIKVFNLFIFPIFIVFKKGVFGHNSSWNKRVLTQQNASNKFGEFNLAHIRSVVKCS